MSSSKIVCEKDCFMADNLKRLVFLTGRPGIGKTSVLLRALDILKAEGYKIGGMVSREARRRGVRVGFEIVDLETRGKGWLAHVDQQTGPRVSKYRVNLGDLNTIGAGSLLNALKNADIIVVDEIGPMELSSLDFKEAMTKAVESRKMMIGTIHYRAHDPLIKTIKAREDTEILEVTRKNRGRLHTILVGRVLQFIQNQS
jgi:nucleoside-triphosphatase